AELRGARVAEVRVRTRARELDLDRASRRLFPLDDFAEAFGNAVDGFKARLIASIGRTAPTISNRILTIPEAVAVLRNAVDHALFAFANVPTEFTGGAPPPTLGPEPNGHDRDAGRD